MNKYNNFSTLEHFQGSVWITKIDTTKETQGVNICQKITDDFRVLQYVIKTEKGFTFNHKKYYSLDDIVNECLGSQGILWMLEDLATCGHCGKSYEETKINMVDYDEDICIYCEKELVK